MLRLFLAHRKEKKWQEGKARERWRLSIDFDNTEPWEQGLRPSTGQLSSEELQQNKALLSMAASRIKIPGAEGLQGEDPNVQGSFYLNYSFAGLLGLFDS